MQITKEMTIDEILSSFPQKGQKLAAALTRAGLECVGCCAATYETLEAGMYGHGMEDEDIEQMVQHLNEIVNQEPLDVNTIQMTQSAAEKFKGILKEEGKEGWGLRFGDHPGGCGGYEYVLDFSEAAGPDDAVFSSYGIEIHVNKKVLPRLIGSEIDYYDGLKNSGFKITNPNVRGACGCGNSQSY
jgi:iron-sulfur cluster assembly protein